MHDWPRHHTAISIGSENNSSINMLVTKLLLFFFFFFNVNKHLFLGPFYWKLTHVRKRSTLRCPPVRVGSSVILTTRCLDLTSLFHCLFSVVRSGTYSVFAFPKVLKQPCDTLHNTIHQFTIFSQLSEENKDFNPTWRKFAYSVYLGCLDLTSLFHCLKLFSFHFQCGMTCLRRHWFDARWNPFMAGMVYESGALFSDLLYLSFMAYD
ncbi:hypothetical protein L9F63_012732, partial [Diploptera punctata]